MDAVHENIPSEITNRNKRPLWSLLNEKTCVELAESCQSRSKLMRVWVSWLKRFSLICSLATAAIAAGTATTTLLLPTARLDEFRNGIGTFLYISSGIVGVPKVLKIPERIASTSVAIGRYEALASQLYHEMSVNMASDREDVTVFIESATTTFKSISDTVSLPDFFTRMLEIPTVQHNYVTPRETPLRIHIKPVSEINNSKDNYAME